MQILNEMSGLEGATESWRAASERIVLVPTMGALHAGHLALVRHARILGERVAVSIFVNPLQFNDAGDLARYPRQEEADIALLRAAGVDLVWLPTPAQLYPEGFATTIRVAGLSERWEGEHRPGHFDGVATVVAKLFTAVRPDSAVFGEKDWQQLAVIRRMTADLGLGVAIVGHPTVREADGLALSSRNALLSAAEREAAAALPRALSRAATGINGGEPVEDALAGAVSMIREAGFGPVDYLAYVDERTLEPLAAYRPGGRLIAAAFLGQTRLIDNESVVADTVSH